MTHFLSIATLVIMLLSSLTTDLIAQKKYQRAGEKRKRPRSLIYEFQNILLDHHISPPKSNKSVTHAAINGIVQSLNDPYARFLNPKQVAIMKRNIKGTDVGVGLKLGIKDGRCTVITTYPNSPASLAGIQSLDIIERIDDTSVSDLSLPEINALLRGSEGSKIRIEYRRLSQFKPTIVQLKRRSYEIPSISRTALFFNSVAYIKIDSFEQKGVAQQFQMKCQELVGQC